MKADSERCPILKEEAVYTLREEHLKFFKEIVEAMTLEELQVETNQQKHSKSNAVFTKKHSCFTVSNKLTSCACSVCTNT